MTASRRSSGFERSTRAGTTISVARAATKTRAHAAALLAVMLLATSLVLTPYAAEAQVDATCGDIAVAAASGAPGLEAAILATNACPGPQIITVEAGTYARRTTFEPITDDLTIIGDAAARPVIRIDITGTYATTFRVEPGATVEFENLVFDDPGGFSCFVCIESATVVVRNVQMNGSFPGRSEGNVAAIWARASALTIENSEINNSDGSAIIGFGGTHVIATNTKITGSSGKGIATDTLVATRVEISGGGEGVNVSGEVTLADSYIWNNTGAGFKQGTRTTSIITNTVFGRDPDGNAGPNGMGVTAFGEMRMSNSVVANSVNQGIEVYPGYLAPASFIDVQVLDNGGSGLSISAATSAEITRVTISGNGAQGLYLLERPATVKDSSITANGTDCSFFRTTAVDAGGNSDSDGTCGFAVPNDAPVAVADAAGVGPTQTIVIDVLANDTDADGDELTVVSVTSPNAAVVTEGKRISYTAPLSFTGETFSYTITDPLGETATAEVVVALSCGDITVTPAGGGAALHAAVDLTEVCPGAQTIFLEPGTYILDTGFAISDELTITGTDPINPARFEFRAGPAGAPYVFLVTDAAGPFTGRNLSIDAAAPWALGYFQNTDAGLERVGFQTQGAPLGCSAAVPSAVTIIGSQLTFDTSQLLLPSCNGISIAPTGSAVVRASLIAGAPGHGIDNEGILAMIASQVAENTGDGVRVTGGATETRIDTSFIWGNGGDGLQTDAYALVTDSAIGLRPEAGELVTAGNVGNGISSNGPLDVENVYIAHNDDGIARFGSSTGTITDATIYDNRSSGLRATGTTATTMSGTSLSSNGPNCTVEPSATLIDAGGNNDDDGTCGTNHSPVAVDETYRIDEDESLDVPAAGVLANDSDEDGDSLTAELVNGPSHATSFELLPSGAFSYVPEADYAGEDTFVYRASDGTFGGEATVTIALRPVNDAPTLDMDETATATLGQATSLSVRIADVDADDSELYGFDATTPAIQLQVEHGTLTATSFGAVVAPPSGSTIAVAGEVEAINKTLATLTYTPDPGYLGPDTLMVTVDDRGENGGGGGLQATGSTLITVFEQNDPPIPANESYETDEDRVLTVAAPGVLNNDVEPEGDDMTAILVTGTSSGIVNLEPDGAFVYEPLADFSGTDQFTYNVSDGVNLSIDATVTITVRAIDDDVRATVTPDSLTFDEDASGQITVSLFDPDSSLDDVAVTAAVVDSTLATVAVDGTGATRTVTVTGEPDAHGSTLVQIGYGHGSPSALLIVPVTITPVNDPPTILSIDDQSTDEDTPFSFQIAIDDDETDVDDLVVTIESTPDELATITRTLQSPGLNVAPLPDVFGNTTVTVTVSDGDAEASTSFELSIVPINDLPVGVPDSYTVDEDTPLKIDDRALGVLGNDSDPNDGDLNGTTLTAVGFTDPQHGSLVGQDDGTFSYEPDTGFFGQDQFSYMASDGEDQTPPITVTITVEPVDDAPTAEPDYYSTDEDVPLLVPPPGVLGNDADTDTPAAELRAVIDSGPATGQLTLAPGGGFTYIPELNLFGTVTFEYHVADATTASAAATVSIEVQPVNDPPVIQAPDMVETLEATPILFDVVIFDVETPVASLDLTALVDDPTAGVVMVGEPDVDGVTQITFTPTAGPGTTVLTLSLLDSATGTPVTTMVTVNVLSPNQTPTAILSAPVAVIEGSGDVTIDATGSTDPDGDVLTYTFTALAGLVDNGDGTAMFSDTQDDGVFEIAVEVCDPSAACDTAQVEMVVLNTAPQLDVDLPGAALAGLAVELDATITDAGVEDTRDLTVDWGDGAIETVVDAGPTTTLTHTFVAAGSYVVVVTVVDDDGGVAQAASTIEIVDAGLLINTTDDGADTNPGDGVCFTGELLADGRAACSLRAAIEESNALPGAQTLDVPDGTYAAATEILITDDLTLIGANRTTTIIEAPLVARVPNVQLTLRSHTLIGASFKWGLVDLTDMAMQNPSGSPDVWTMLDSELVGGAIYVSDDVSITDSGVGGDAAVGGFGTMVLDTVDFVDSQLYTPGHETLIVASTFDSAIVYGRGDLTVEGSEIIASRVQLSGSGDLAIQQSLLVDTIVTLSGEAARIVESEAFGGRLTVGPEGILVVTNSTLTSPLVSAVGEIRFDSSLLVEPSFDGIVGTVRFANSTVEGGEIDARDIEPFSTSYGSLFIESSTVSAPIMADWRETVHIRNSYVETCEIANGATVTVVNSADSDSSCLTWPLAGIDPLLGPLQDNGGPTHTFALLENSPLLDAVEVGAECPATDQRGEPRPFDADDDGTATCDIGAFEAQAVLVDPETSSFGYGQVDLTIEWHRMFPGSADPGGRLFRFTSFATQRLVSVEDLQNCAGPEISSCSVPISLPASGAGGYEIEVLDLDETWSTTLSGGCGRDVGAPKSSGFILEPAALQDCTIVHTEIGIITGPTYPAFAITQIWNPGASGTGEAQLQVNGQNHETLNFNGCGNPTLSLRPMCSDLAGFSPTFFPHIEIEPADGWTTTVGGACVPEVIEQRLVAQVVPTPDAFPVCLLTHTWLGESPNPSSGVVHLVLDWQPLDPLNWTEPGGTVLEFVDGDTTVRVDLREVLGNLCPNVNQDSGTHCQFTTTLPLSSAGFEVSALNFDSTWVMNLTGDCSIPVDDPDGPGKGPGPGWFVVGLSTIQTCAVTFVEVGVPIDPSSQPFILEQLWASAGQVPGVPIIRINGTELDDDMFFGCGNLLTSSSLSCEELLVYNSLDFPPAEVVPADGWATTLSGDCTVSLNPDGRFLFAIDDGPGTIPRCTLTHNPLIGPPGGTTSGLVDLTLRWQPLDLQSWTPPVDPSVDFVDPNGASISVAIEDYTLAFPCPGLLTPTCQGLVAIPPSSQSGYDINVLLPGPAWVAEFSQDCAIAPGTTKDQWFFVEPASLLACTITVRELIFDVSDSTQPLEIRQVWNSHDVSSWGEPEIRINTALIDDEVFFGCGNPYVGRIPDCSAIVSYNPESQPQLQVQPALNWTTAISGDCVATVTPQELYAEVTPSLGAIPHCTLTHTWASTVLALSRGGAPFEKVWPGDVLDLRADNFKPGALVSVFVGDELVTTTTVDSQGRVAAAVGPISDREPGSYMVAVRGPGIGGDETEATVEIEIEDPPDVRIRTIVQTIRELDPGAEPITPIAIELRDAEEVEVDVAAFMHRGSHAPEELDFGDQCAIDGDSDVVFGGAEEGEPVRITLENGPNLLPLQFCHDDEPERTARLRIEVTDAESGELYAEGYVVILDDDLVTLQGPRELIEGGVVTGGSIPVPLPDGSVIAFWPPPLTTSTNHSFTYGVAPWAQPVTVYLDGVATGTGNCESLVVPQPDMVLVNGFTGGAGTIVTCGDSIPEADRQVELVFVSYLGVERFPLTLVDDDFAPTFAEGQEASVAEPTFGQDPERTTFTIDIADPVDHPYQVRVTTRAVGEAVVHPDGSCQSDVQFRDNLLTIPANASSVDVHLVICPAAPSADLDGVFHLAFGAPSPAPILNPFFELPITILDRSLPHISAAPVTADEDDGDVRVTFDVTTPSASGLWIRTVDGSANGGSDYVGVGGLLTAAALDLDPGETGTVSIDIGLVDDTVDEDTELFAVEVWTAAIGGQRVATAHVTIVDDDAPPVIRGIDLVVTEPAGNISSDSPTVQVQFEIDEPGAATSLWPRIVGGSATSSDYNWDDTPFDLAEGFVAPIGVSVTVINNGIPEPDETLEIALFDSFTGGKQVASATLTIKDEDREFPVLASPDSVVITEDGDNAILTFDVLESPSAGVTLNVRWRPVSGNPTAGLCSFFGLGGSDDIGGGFGDWYVSTVREAVVVSVGGCPDNELESDKVIDVVVTTPEGTELASTRVTMLDDDTPPELRLLDVTIQEGDPTGPLLNPNFNRVGTLSVEVVQPPERDYLVTLQPRPGDGSVSFGLACFPVPPFGAPDAIAGPFRTATIPADTAPGSILEFDHVLACRNEDPDPTRSYEIEVVDGPGESGGVNDRAVVTIEDDDGAPPSDARVSITNASVTEGNSGSRVVTVDVTVAAGNVPLGLTWATAAADPSVGTSATTGSDYLAASGELFFGAHGGTQTLELTVFGDELVEVDEWFRVTLTDDQGVKLTAEANVRIRDDEYIAIRVLDAPEVVEGDSGLRTMTFTVTASAEPPANATFYLGTHDAVDASLVPLDPGRASAGSDYNSKYAGLTFGPGLPLSQAFTVSVRGDQANEQSEAIYVAVAAFGGPGYTSTTIERGTAVGLIRDDDGPPTITGPTELRVTMGESAITVPIVYPVTARDSESNAVPVVCSPPSGSQFAAGTHLARCTATDSSGNTATLTLTIVVSKGRGDRLSGFDGSATSQTQQGSTVQVTASGYAAASFVAMELRSDPLDLGRAQADADGTVNAWVTIPVDAPIGPHTIAIIGHAADGKPLQVLLPIEVQRRLDVVTLYPAQPIGANPAAAEVAATVPTAVPELATAAVQPVTPSPSGPLAYTGAAAVGLLQLALMLLGAGCTLAAESRRRRR